MASSDTPANDDSLADAQGSVRRKQWKFAAWGLGAIVVAVLLVLLLTPEPDTKTNSQRPAPPVTVTSVSPDSYQAVIRVDSVATARETLTLRSAVNGPVTRLKSGLLPGQRVRAGETLVWVNDTPMQAALADARNRLAAAELALETQKREGEQAVSNWQMAQEAGAPPPMVARTPQIKAAQAERDAAKAALRHARQDLSYSRITAPFSGVIVDRMVARGFGRVSGDALTQLLQ